MKRLALLVAWGVAAPALAHPLSPALLQLREQPDGHYEVLWRSSTQRAQRDDVLPRLPATCSEPGAPPAIEVQGTALTVRWTVRCGALDGQVLGFDGLDRSLINVIARIEFRDGAVLEELLDARRPRLTIATPAAAPPVFAGYFALGIGHLLGGLDHLLFLAGLFLLVSGWKRLLAVITAFTVGHSVTLALSTLGYLRVNPVLTELGIALSILVLALELAKRRDVHHLSGVGADSGKTGERPYFLMGGAFGLLHGLGFAGALAQVGLPADAIPRALLGFNLGIEAGQVGAVAALVAARWGLVQISGWFAQQHGPTWKFEPGPVRTLLPAYVIGTLAAYWCFERASALFT